MNKTNMMKKFMITGLTFAMVIGGATSAFADGDDKDKDHEKSSKEKSSQNVKAKFKFSFDDVEGGDVSWSAKSIASLASKQVFQGYEDGTFRPRNTIKRIEAITAAVRLLGLKDQAESATEMATELNFKDADKIEKQYAWAVGYVAVAAENDLFAESETSVQPEKAASRLWATTLLVKALKLDAEAKAKINTKLTFKDADEIPAGSVGYVAVALEKGLITGFENNTFRPNASVTRAQLAALLDRTNDQMVGNDAVKGSVTAAVYNNTLTVKSGSVTQNVYLDPNVFVFRDGVKVTASALVVDDKVKIHLYNGVAVFIEVVKEAAPVIETQNFTVNGFFSSLTLNADNKITGITILRIVNGLIQTSTYAVASDVNVDQSKLILNQKLELEGSNTTIYKIKIK